MAENKHMAGVLICGIICGIAMFASSLWFVNAEVTPKWLCLMACAGLTGIAWSVLNRKNTLSVKHDTILIKYLYGTIIVFAVTLAIHGLLQYTGFLAATNSNFAITGSFDNPAGFASALVCALPLCFVFFTDRTVFLKYAAIAAAVIIASAIFLSGSRAGMFAVAAATAVWFIARAKIKNLQSKLFLIVVLITLPAVLYFVKKDSADGRLLIWRCTWDMIAEKPILGHGYGAFQAKYMLYQATYLDANPDSNYAQLADNSIRPFNEYLLVLTEY